MPNTRNLIKSGTGILTFIAAPASVAALILSLPLELSVPVGSVLGIAIVGGYIYIVVREHRELRRKIEKEAFGKVLTSTERKLSHWEYKEAKSRYKYEQKLQRQALKAEEKARNIRSREVKLDELKKKARELPLRITLAGVKFLTVLTTEIPKAMLEADQLVQTPLDPPTPPNFLTNKDNYLNGKPPIPLEDGLNRKLLAPEILDPPMPSMGEALRQLSSSNIPIVKA